MSKNSLVDKLTVLILPLVEAQSCELYHLEYVKEGGENFLRIYIDKEEGISLEDCEKVNRSTSEMLDVEDPIVDPYYLEVSSPGIFRILHNDKHLEKYKGDNVVVNLYSLFEGKKKIEGALMRYDSKEITLESEGKEVSIPREKISNISLNGEL